MSNCEQTAVSLLGMFPFTLAVCLKPEEMTSWPVHEHFTSTRGFGPSCASMRPGRRSSLKCCGKLVPVAWTISSRTFQISVGARSSSPSIGCRGTDGYCFANSVTRAIRSHSPRSSRRPVHHIPRRRRTYDSSHSAKLRQTWAQQLPSEPEELAWPNSNRQYMHICARTSSQIEL